MPETLTLLFSCTRLQIRSRERPTCDISNCHLEGNSRWVHSMEWSGQKDFVSSHEQTFVVDGIEAGVLKSHGPLSFLKVHNAGHMVPMDQPKASLEMLRRFTQGKLKESLPESTIFKVVM